MRTAAASIRLLPLLLLLPGSAAPAAVQTSEPIELVQSALRQHRVVFLGDVHPFAEPKLLVARLVREQRLGAIIDLLALEVGSEHQAVIDRYLAVIPEDTTILLDRPRTLRSHWGASAEYLGIYRAVYRWNHDHPDRPVGILAADLRGWPMAPLTERMATSGFAYRDEWMAAGLRRVLAAHPEWRVLVFMGGYHGLKSIGGRVTLGGATDRFDRWLAGYLADADIDIYTVLTDARHENGHGATRVFDHLAAARPGANFAIELDSTSDRFEQPLHDVSQGGYALEFRPHRFPLRHAVDALLLLTRPTPITPLRRARREPRHGRGQRQATS
jgi:hypothetical protein